MFLDWGEKARLSHYGPVGESIWYSYGDPISSTYPIPKRSHVLKDASNPQLNMSSGLTNWSVPNVRCLQSGHGLFCTHFSFLSGTDIKLYHCHGYLNLRTNCRLRWWEQLHPPICWSGQLCDESLLYTGDNPWYCPAPECTGQQWHVRPRIAVIGPDSNSHYTWKVLYQLLECHTIQNLCYQHGRMHPFTTLAILRPK